MASEKKLFTAAEICTIIEASGKANVRRLKLADFEVEFGAQPERLEISSQTPAPLVLPEWLRRDPTPPSATPLGSAIPGHPKQEENTLVAEEIRFREDQLALMRIEDPLAYEQLLQVEGELVDDGSIDDDDGTDGREGAQALRTRPDVQRR